jgi:DNA-binding CsgD family transcriptional regulator
MSLDLGMHNGYTIPLRNAYPLSAGALSLVASNEFSGEAFINHLNDVGEDLRLIAEAFHTALRRPLLVEPEDRLTDRERECLLWSIQGLRAQQIAERIGTKTKTVEKQIASARQRLHARTNAQAAVKAILLGLIAP